MIVQFFYGLPCDNGVNESPYPSNIRIEDTHNEGVIQDGIQYEIQHDTPTPPNKRSKRRHVNKLNGKPS